MIRERVVAVLLSVLIIVLVAVAQERSRHLAAIIGAMPLSAPAIWLGVVLVLTVIGRWLL